MSTVTRVFEVVGIWARLVVLEVAGIWARLVVLEVAGTALDSLSLVHEGREP